MLGYIEYLNVPTKVAIALVGVFLFMQIIGELLEFKGKIVPEFLKIRKYFARKKKEREEMVETLNAVKQLLDDVNIHYSEDNIKKRDGWMQWVNDRATVYDNSIVEIHDKIERVVQALQDNTKMTEEMFVQSSRDRIIDFANKTVDEKTIVSREEYNRIFKVYDRYEEFLKERELTNGEIDIAMHMIKESYEQHMKSRTFLENVRGYDA